MCGNNVLCDYNIYITFTWQSVTGEISVQISTLSYLFSQLMPLSACGWSQFASQNIDLGPGCRLFVGTSNGSGFLLVPQMKTTAGAECRLLLLFCFSSSII